MDSNPLAKVKAEGQREIRIFELRIRIPLDAKFKSHSSDSNPIHSDSNPGSTEALNAQPATPAT